MTESQSVSDETTDTVLHVYLHRTGQPLIEFVGAAEELEKQGHPAIGWAFHVVKANNRAAMFCTIGDEVGVPTDAGYSATVGASGELAVYTTPDGNHVVTYGPSGWREYGPFHGDQPAPGH